jgi:hypothetical protein
VRVEKKGEKVDDLEILEVSSQHPLKIPKIPKKFSRY